MPITKYFTNGNLDDDTGLTLSVQEFDDEGNLLFGLVSAGKPNAGFQAQEITKEQFDALRKQLEDKTVSTGLAGIISDKHLAKLEVKHKAAKLAVATTEAEAAHRKLVKLTKRAQRLNMSVLDLSELLDIDLAVLEAKAENRDALLAEFQEAKANASITDNVE